jgi:hypothetical protein
MQPTTGFHHFVPPDVRTCPNDIMNDAIFFNTPNHMLDPDADGRYPTIFRFLFHCERSALWFLFRLHNLHITHFKALKARILDQYTPRRQLVACFVGNPFIMRFAFIGVA